MEMMLIGIRIFVIDVSSAMCVEFGGGREVMGTLIVLDLNVLIRMF